MINNRYWAAALVAIAGCGRGLPPAANADRAREALQTALEVWKEGKSRESLREQTPAIYFSDDLWDVQARLVDYEIQPGAPNGQGWRCDVQQTLQSGDGPRRERVASYQIDTDPAIVIVEQP
jgi:hypothetical protein